MHQYFFRNLSLEGTVMFVQKQENLHFFKNFEHSRKSVSTYMFHLCNLEQDYFDLWLEDSKSLNIVFDTVNYTLHT